LWRPATWAHCRLLEDSVALFFKHYSKNSQDGEADSPPRKLDIGGVSIFLAGVPADARVGSEDVTGFELWQPATRAASEFLVSNPSLVQGRTVLELGCGLGALGILCAKLGASWVCLTDKEDQVLQLAKKNAVMNSVSSRCDVMTLDFTVSATVCLRAPFDLVVASDVLFLDKLAAPLQATILSLTPKAAVLGHEVRKAVYRGPDGLPCVEEHDSALTSFLKAGGSCWEEWQPSMNSATRMQ